LATRKLAWQPQEKVAHRLKVERIIQNELDIFQQSVRITNLNKIPETHRIPIEKPSVWQKVPGVICCFVDMEGSTQLSAGTNPQNTAKAYRLFTETAIRIFHEFSAAYIDVKGDGVFALFNENQPYRALAATVSFKSFVNETFTPKVKQLTQQVVGGHFGIDQKDVLVRRFGLKSCRDRTDRQNEVWAGKPINMAAKLASLSTDNNLLVSDRFFRNITSEEATHSCGCGNPGEEKSPLWTEMDLTEDPKFDFKKAYALKSNWCKKCGQSFCRNLARLNPVE
jgi:class 3 adenylate cyclase